MIKFLITFVFYYVNLRAIVENDCNVYKRSDHVSRFFDFSQTPSKVPRSVLIVLLLKYSFVDGAAAFTSSCGWTFFAS